MAAVERRDPLLIAARAHKTLHRAAWAAYLLGDEALQDDLLQVCCEVYRICGNHAIVRRSSNPAPRDCA